MIWSLIGILGVITTSSQLLPQIYKAFQTKHTKDVSFGLGIVVAFNAIVWLSYGLHLSDFAIVIANSISLCCAITLLLLKVKMDKEHNMAVIKSESEQRT